MRLALADAGLEPGDIGHINAHGTSTPLNDAAEAAAITEVFGPGAVPMTSTKGVTGHALGAAGALEAVAMLLAIEHRLIPPTAGTTVVDPEFTIDLVVGCGPTMGAGAVDLEQPRFRRAQRERHHRSGPRDRALISSEHTET